MFDLVDPTMTVSAEEHTAYVPRPQHLLGLRIGLVENTTRNSEAMLRKIAEKLETAHGMKMEVLVHKPQRAAIKDAQIEQLKARTDFAIVGVGA